jgi:hypothetical protein
MKEQRGRLQDQLRKSSISFFLASFKIQIDSLLWIPLVLLSCNFPSPFFFLLLAELGCESQCAYGFESEIDYGAFLEFVRNWNLVEPVV